MTPFTRVASALTAALAALAPLATTAHADSWRHPDLRHDVRHYKPDGTATVRPRATDPDVTRTVVRHGPDRLTIAISAREVSPRTKFAFLTVVTPADSFDVAVFFSDKTAMVYHHNGDQVACEGLGFRRMVRADRIRVGVPRACLGRPAWVRVGAGLASFGHSPARGEFDDALGGRHSDDEHLVLSRRVPAA